MCCVVKDPTRFQTEKTLFDFSKKGDFKCLSVFSDEAFGGCSKASLEHDDQVRNAVSKKT